MDQPRVRVVGLASSARPGSASGAALRRVLACAGRLGAETALVDLQRMRLPFCNGDKHEPWDDYPDVTRLRETIRRADGIVLATPEYHGSLSGALKNAIDLLDFPHVEGKVFAAISALGGRPNSNALNHVRTIVRALRAWMVPEQVAIPNARHAFGPDGQPYDPEVAQRLDELSYSLVRSARLLGGGASAAGHGLAGGQLAPSGARPPAVSAKNGKASPR